MISDEIIMECGLADGITAVVRDASRHYFGGYYHVRLHVTADVALSHSWFGSDAEYEDAVGRLGRSVRYSRTLEKMAVPLAEIDYVRNGLLKAFESNLLPYIFRADFPRCFALSEYGRARKPVAARGYAGA